MSTAVQVNVCSDCDLKTDALEPRHGSDPHFAIIALLLQQGTLR